MSYDTLMKQTLTTKSIDALKPATAKRYEVRDIGTPGLHLRVSVTGAKVFYLSARANGQRRRIKIGPYPIVSLVDRKFAKQVRDHYRHANGGVLQCEACGCEPAKRYGPAGESSMEAHHKIPIEQLQPDSVTLVQDMAMVCASCQWVIHSKKPCLTIEEVRQLLASNGSL